MKRDMLSELDRCSLLEQTQTPPISLFLSLSMDTEGGEKAKEGAEVTDGRMIRERGREGWR